MGLVVELEAVSAGGAIQVDGQGGDAEDRSKKRCDAQSGVSISISPPKPNTRRTRLLGLLPVDASESVLQLAILSLDNNTTSDTI